MQTCLIAHQSSPTSYVHNRLYITHLHCFRPQVHINYAMCGPPGLGDVSHTNDAVLEGQYGLGGMEELEDPYLCRPYLVGREPHTPQPGPKARRFLGGEQLPISGRWHCSCSCFGLFVGCFLFVGCLWDVFCKQEYLCGGLCSGHLWVQYEIY